MARLIAPTTVGRGEGAGSQWAGGPPPGAADGGQSWQGSLGDGLSG